MGKFITILYPFIVILMFYQVILLADLTEFSSLAFFEKTLIILGLVFSMWILMVASWRWIYRPVWALK